jgi:hypothetical protein
MNRLFIRLFDFSELNQLRKTILNRLIQAEIRRHGIEAKPTDLTDEAAWVAVKKYWRPE